MSAEAPELQQNSSDIIYTSFDQAAIEERYHCRVDVERCELVLSAAIGEYKREYKDGEGGFFKGKKQAEEEYINFLISQGESPENIANALFLLAMVTFGSSSALFYNGLSKDPKQFEKDRFLLVPSEVIKHKKLTKKQEKLEEQWIAEKGWLPGLDEVKVGKKVCGINNYEDSFNKRWKDYIQVKGRQGDALDGWYTNCKVLCGRYGGSVFNLFKACDNDAVKVMHLLTDKPKGKSSNKELKRFDKKLAALFLQWVGTYHLYELSNMEEFGLPVDFQLCRIAVQTGIINVVPDGKLRRKEFANEVFLPLIAMLCKKNGWEPRLVSESLWLIGSQGCTYDQKRKTPHDLCPLGPYCRGVLHKMDNDFLVFTYEGILKKLRLWGAYEQLPYVS